MTWSDPETRQTGDLITAAIWNQDVVENTLHLKERGLGPADYDSGWFAVGYNQTYSKAHGLGSAPRIVEVWHAAVAAPGSGDELVWALIGRISASYAKAMMGVDAANVTITTLSGSADGTVWSSRRASGGGYYRILAWA